MRMKKIFTILTASTILSGLGYAQSIEIHHNGVALTGVTATIDSAATVDHTKIDYYLVNTSGSPIEIDWTRIRRADMAPYTDQVCDDVYCYQAPDNNVFVSPSYTTIPAGDSMLFQPKVYPNTTAGCAIYTYIIYSGHGTTFEDSVQVKYRFGGQDCFLTVQETPITFSVYPNPVSTNLNIKATTNGNSVVIKLYNIMGELVRTETITDGNNMVNVSSLTDGIYFYSIIKNNQIVETKKLIIKH